MVEMNIRELYEVGTTFESAVGQGTKGERARILKIIRELILQKIWLIF